MTTSSNSAGASHVDDRNQKNRARADHRRTVVSKIRDTRESLASETGQTLNFDRDALIAHASNMKAAGFVLPWLVVFIGLVSLNWHDYVLVLTWLVAALITQGLVIYQNIRLLKSTPTERSALSKWRSSFVCGDLLNGIMLAAFMLIPITSASQSQPVFVFTTFLIVIAIYSFVTAPLFSGMLAATTPITMLLFLKYTETGYMSMMIMAGLFVAAQLLFILVAKQVKDTLQKLFAVKAEKDELILELEEATAISNESRRRAEEANLAKSRFLATMSHELRTPLNAILGFSEIMKGELLGPLDNPSYKEYVSDIHASGDHLLKLINEILDLSRIEAGRYELKEDAVSISDVVDDCYNLMQLRAKAKDIKMKVMTEPDMPRVWADEKAIRQIVLNLMSNAVKFTPSNGEIKVLVGWTAGGGQYVSVHDNGPGIPEEEIPIVLSQFGQGSLAIKSAEQGTGLGLPICQALVNMHGGTFDFRSKLRQGTSVTISLPRTRVMQALSRNKSEAARDQINASNRRVARRSA